MTEGMTFDRMAELVWEGNRDVHDAMEWAYDAGVQDGIEMGRYPTRSVRLGEAVNDV